MKVTGRLAGVGFLLGLSATFTGRASAQTAAAPATPGAPAPQPAGGPAVAGEVEAVAVPHDLLRADPGGITAEQVGLRAVATSYSAKAAEENMRAAAARVDQAWVSFLPRITGTGRYTRLSDFTAPSLFSLGDGRLVGTLAPAGTLNPSPTQAFEIKGGGFPIILNNYLLQASIVVPISDYFLRISQAYTATTHAQEAARLDVQSTRARSSSEGKIAYYTWVRARGAVIVATQAMNDQKTHLRDARNQFNAGNASRVDVLRAETGVAAAELALERARNLAELSEKQVRVAIHARDEDKLTLGESVDGPTPAFPGSLRELTSEALSQRTELKSLDANVLAAKQQARVASASQLPSVSGFGDATYANPNQRRVPQNEEWFGTWQVGAQVVWSPNDLLGGRSAALEAEARVSALEAQRLVIRDGIEIEATQAYQAVREADFALESTKRELTAAEEAHRVARELFNNGRATSTTLTDAETDLTRARLAALNARVDGRVARVRLEHALGRDAVSAVAIANAKAQASVDRGAKSVVR